MTASVTCKTVKRFYATRTFLDFDGEERTIRKGFAHELTAWKWVARSALFRARDERCGCKKIADSYKGSPAWDGGPEQCCLCDDRGWRPIVNRLARILRSRNKQ